MRDDTGEMVLNGITLNRIPLRHAVHLNSAPYDARSLVKWFGQSQTVPHTRRRLTAEEVANVRSRGSTSTVRERDARRLEDAARHDRMREKLERDARRLEEAARHDGVVEWRASLQRGLTKDVATQRGISKFVGRIVETIEHNFDHFYIPNPGELDAVFDGYTFEFGRVVPDAPVTRVDMELHPNAYIFTVSVDPRGGYSEKMVEITLERGDEGESVANMTLTSGSFPTRTYWLSKAIEDLFGSDYQVAPPTIWGRA